MVGVPGADVFKRRIKAWNKYKVSVDQQLMVEEIYILLKTRISVIFKADTTLSICMWVVFNVM